MNVDLEIPAFLRATVRRPPARSIRWRKMKAERPAAERWASATRWDIFVTDAVPKLGTGRRRVWVVEGRKWVRLHDAEAQVKIPMSLWRQLQRHGKEVLS